MTGAVAEKQAHVWERADKDWYVEPPFAVKCLADTVRFRGEIYDPACGRGTIPEVFAERGHRVSGSDIADRGYGYRKDFLAAQHSRWANIVTNPPYSHAQAFIEQSLAYTIYKVAVIVQIGFLASVKRHAWFKRSPVSRVVILSKRPSMPPGDQYDPDKDATGGSTDFCWLVFDHDHDGPPIIDWACPLLRGEP